MKLASYVADGKRCFGVVAGDGVITLNGRLGGRYGGLREALAAGALAEIAKHVDGAKPDHKLGEIEWLPAIPDPAKILCAGINYRSHASETRAANRKTAPAVNGERSEKLAEGEGFEPPEPFPIQWFSRPPPSTARPSLRGEVSLPV